MKTGGIILMLLTSLLLDSCSCLKDGSKINTIVLQEKPSFEIGNIWFQKWIAGVQGVVSGIHMYLQVETNKNHVVFDSLYFRGQKAKLNIGKIGYIASFKTPLNQKKDLIMDGDPRQEYGNEPPQDDKSVPFKLQENECVIQYTQNGISKYYKFADVVEKQTEYYPSAPNNKEKQ